MPPRARAVLLGLLLGASLASPLAAADATVAARDAGCSDLILLKCTSAYPATAADANLATLPHLRDLFHCEVGLSDHTMGVGVAVAAVAYGTDDGGFLNGQAPPGNGNNNLEPGEFLRIPVGAVADRKLNGVYDILDAERNFAVAETVMDAQNRPVLRWPVVPGVNYQVQSRDTFGTGSWQNLLTTPWTAGDTQWEMEFTDTNAPATNRFYRVTQP